MNWLVRLRGGSPKNDTSSEEMEEMVFNDPEGDDYLTDTEEDDAIDIDRGMDNAPSQQDQGGGFLSRLFGR